VASCCAGPCGLRVDGNVLALQGHIGIKSQGQVDKIGAELNNVLGEFAHACLPLMY
jgi:hypothetical protein